MSSLLCACGTSGSRDTRPRSLGPPAHLSDGSLVYRNARPRGGRGQRQRHLEALVITSVPEESRRLKYDDDIVVSADVVEGDRRAEKTDRRTIRKIFGDLETKPKNVSPDRLEAIWDALRGFGIERFPIHPGSTPPENVPSITVIEGDRQWIFVKYDATILALGDDDQRELLAAWGQCHGKIIRAYSYGE